jgi:hypothetical protein
VVEEALIDIIMVPALVDLVVVEKDVLAVMQEMDFLKLIHHVLVMQWMELPTLEEVVVDQGVVPPLLVRLLDLVERDCVLFLILYHKILCSHFLIMFNNMGTSKNT